MVAVVSIIAVACIVAAVVTFAIVARRRSREPAAIVPPPPRVVGPARPYVQPLSTATGVVEVVDVVRPSAGSSPLFDIDLEPEIAAPAVAEIRWSNQFDPRSGVLDDTARLRLIGDLGVVAQEWCVPLLCQAYAEERRPANRQAALISLAACRSRTAVATFRLALGSSDAGERAIATDGLADLEPPPQKKRRPVAERR